MSLTPSPAIRALRREVGYPRRYLFFLPAWLEGWRYDFRDDIEAEYLLDQPTAADVAREEA